MKKFIAIIVALAVLGFGVYTFAGKDEVICPCGCEKVAVVCGCEEAVKLLESLKDA